MVKTGGGNLISNSLEKVKGMFKSRGKKDIKVKAIDGENVEAGLEKLENKEPIVPKLLERRARLGL